MTTLEKKLIDCCTNFGYCLALQGKIKEAIKAGNFSELPAKFPQAQLSDVSIENYLSNLDAQIFEMAADIGLLRYSEDREELAENFLKSTSNLREALEEELRFFGQKNIQ